MSVTIRQISAASGFSIRTVSRVLRMPDGGPHKGETRERILATARAMGYRPNAAARAARTGRFNAVAMLLGRRQDQSYLRPGLLDGICDVLDRHDLHLTIARIPDESLTDEAYVPKLLREWMADGMLINYVYGFPARMVELVERYELPSIWINTLREADCVYADSESAAREATERLLDWGHRRIAYHTFEAPPLPADGSAHYAMADREQGYRTAMEAAGLQPRLLSTERPESRLVWAAAVREIFTGRAAFERPSAVIAATENDAASVVLGAAMAGLRVPEDLSVLTFAGGLFTSAGVAVDSMALDRREMGARAVQMLLEKIERPHDRLPQRVLGFTYLAGGTVSVPAL